MEKLIIYAIGGILYFLYTAWKKQQEPQKPVPKSVPQTEAPVENEPRPIRPPAHIPFKEAIAEEKRKQAAAEARKKLSTTTQTAQTVFQKPAQPKDIFIHEKKKATFGQGADDAPVYERDVPASEKIVRGDIKLKNEGIYRVETMEEARALADNTDVSVYEFDAKQAFIGSVIFERKFG
jgi:hypothetical protein